jgi:hypothetical protein
VSEHTPCNHCSLEAMKRRAAERGVTVIMGRDRYGWITARYSDEDEPCAHFAILTDMCVC